MKKLLLAILALALILLPMGCDIDIESMIRKVIEELIEDLAATYTIKVIGPVGLNITGEYVVVSIDVDPDSDSMDFSDTSYEVKETLPPVGYVEYTHDDAVSVVGMFQKQGGEDMLLRVEIWKGDQLVDSSETTSPWGAILVAAYP